MRILVPKKYNEVSEMGTATRNENQKYSGPIREGLLYLGGLFVIVIISAVAVFGTSFIIFNTKQISPSIAFAIIGPGMVLFTYFRLRKHDLGFCDIGITFQYRQLFLFLASFLAGVVFIGVFFIIVQLLDLIAVNQNPEFQITVIYLLLFITTFAQSGLEELIFRGYLFRVFQKNGLYYSVIVTSVVFSIIHLMQGFNALGLLNIFLFGALMALIVFVTNNLWIPIGLHAGWNIAQLQIFGFQMYGRYGMAPVTVIPLGNKYLVGGSYGPEASIILTVLLIAASISVLLIGVYKVHKNFS